MADDLNQLQNQAGAPPAPEVAIRTMESDVRSMEQSGGAGTVPQIFTPGSEGALMTRLIREPQAHVEPPKIEAQLGVPGYTGPEAAIFKPTGTIQAELSKESINKWRLFFIIIGVLAVIAAFWALGYFVIFPWLFPPQMPAVPVQ